MGVRITLFALDLDHFTTFVQQSVWEWLWYFVDNGAEQGDAVRIGTPGKDHAKFLATPQKGVVAIGGSKNIRLDRDKKPADSFFSCSLQDYLVCNSPWELHHFLTALSRCPSNDSVRLVTKGHRRWWIGSLLDYAEKTLGSAAPDYIYLESLFQRVLQGHDCGKLLRKNDDRTAEARLPIVLQEDADLRTSVWTDEETWFVIETIRSIVSETTTFARPPGKVGIAPETNEEWNDWVQDMIGKLLAVDELPPRMRNVVGFIC